MDTTRQNGHKRAVIYCRVSTDEQAAKGYSLPSQVIAGRDYAQRQGFAIVGEFFEDYTGTIALEQRPEGKRAYKMLAEGDADALIVYTVDRLVRPPQDGDEWDMPVLIRGLAKLDKEIHTLDRGQLKTDFASLLIAMLDAKGAADDRRKMIERTTRGRKHKATSGQVVGVGKAPYGYKYVKTADKITMLEIDENQAAVVRMIFEWYTVGRDGRRMGATLIARELIKIGIPTPSESGGYKRTRTTAPGVWGSDVIYWILKSETYTGVWRFGKYIGAGGHGGKRDKSETVMVTVPPIIDATTWGKAQSLRSATAQSLRERGKRDYLLTGFMKCGCGCAFHGSSGRYKCSSQTNIRRHYAAERCHEPNVNADRVERIIWDHVYGLITNIDQLEQRLRDARNQAYDTLKPKRDELAIVDEMLQETEAEAGDIANALIEARGSKLVAARLQAQAQEVDDRHAKLTTRREALKAEIEQATISDNDIATLAQFQADALAGLDNATPDKKRHWLELLKVRVKVEGRQAEVTCLVSQPGTSRVLELKEIRLAAIC